MIEDNDPLGFWALIANKELTADDCSRVMAEFRRAKERGMEVLYSPLLIAISAHDPVNTAMLLRAGADPMERLPSGATLLMEASNGGCFVIPLLLAAGIKVDDTDDLGETALMVAAKNGDLSSAKVLRAAGADPDRKNQAGKSARDMILGWSAKERQAAGFNP